MLFASPIITNRENMLRIREKLLSYNYKISTILSRLKIKKYRSNRPSNEEIPHKINNFLSRSPTDETDILIRVFTLNTPTDIKLFKKIFSDFELSMLVDMKLVSLSDDNNTVDSDIALFECDDLIIATDSVVKKSIGINPVMPLFQECYEFDAIRTRKKVNKTLDICTGSGIHALLASRHSEKVTGVDISPRAIMFSKFNAALNDIRNINFIEGDLYEPIGEESFDLILANPPYMPMTDSLPGANWYCGGKKGDVLWSKIIQGLNNHLKINGLCQMIHLMIFDNNKNYEEKLNSFIGESSYHYSTIVMSDPIDFKNENITDTSIVEFGVTNIRRNETINKNFYCHVPFVIQLSFDVNDLFSALIDASTKGEMQEIVKSFYL